MITELPKNLCQLHEELLQGSRQFFALPLAEKEKVDYHQSREFRGYMRQGTENTAGQVDWREQVEFGREEPRRQASDHLYSRLRGPNQWPSQPSSLRPLVLSWLEEMEELSRKLTRALSVSLGLSETSLDGYFQQPHVQAKIVHYPPSNGGGLGVGAHADSGFLTLLWQDEAGGLEFLDAQGCWIPALPIPASMVCNLGEVVQLLTGGVYPATVHRVLRPGAAGRVSLPYFWNPSLDVEVRPLELGALPAQLLGRPKESENKMLPSYGMNAFKSLARSHPEVFARHHPDLACLPDGEVVYKSSL
ncbi:unnamed protein product [Effrenium voratum]|nr:unnamed protein product [Effrenium voratum]